MSNQMLEINPKNIVERPGFNTRYDLGDLRDLKASMANGFNQAFPLIVTKDLASDGKYILGSQGHRRLAVAKELGLKTVFVTLEDESLSDADRNLDIIRLNTGEPLPMLAAARVVDRALQDKEVSKSDVAKLLGKSPTFIGDCVKLTATTPQTQKRIEQEKITAYQVVELVNELKGDMEAVEVAVEKLIDSAGKQGKKKVTKKVKDVAEGEETEEERELRLAEEKEEKAKDKAFNLELQGYKKRSVKFIDNAVESDIKVKAAEDVSAFDKALNNLTFMMAAYLSGKEEMAGGLISASDVWANVRGVAKAHKETLKETVTEVKAEASEKVDALKAQVKETKEQAAARVKKAKEAVAAV